MFKSSSPIFNIYFYARVSTENQDFLSQKINAEKFVSDKPHLKIIKIFEEKSSAYNQIPQTMIEMVLEIESMPLSCRPHIMVKNVDRFSRSIQYGTECLDKILSLGIDIIFYTLPHINVRTVEGRNEFNKLLMEAEAESKKISERVIFSLKARKEAGYMITKEPPFGKRLIAGNDDKMMEDCPEEIHIKGIIYMLNKEFTMREILKSIRDYERTFLGKKSDMNIYGALIDPSYRNEIFYGNDEDYARILNFFKIYKRGEEWRKGSIYYQWKKCIEPYVGDIENSLKLKLALIDDVEDEIYANSLIELAGININFEEEF